MNKWTEEDRDKMLEMAERNMSIAEIAKALGRTEAAIEVQSQIYGTRPKTKYRRWSAAEVRELDRRLRFGEPINTMGIDEWKVRNKMRSIYGTGNLDKARQVARSRMEV